MEEAVRSKDNIKLANSIFKLFRKFRLSADERREIYLDAVWYTLTHWIPEKSAFQTYLCNNVWYKSQTYIKKKLKKREQTNCNLTGYISNHNMISNDFDNLVAKLHDNYKTPIIQKFVYNMTASEIGEANGYDRSYASQMIKKGLEKLKKSV